jgi:Chemotaxis response regulator containing a CheY-like receiver domain and a methylesterase domain
VSVDVIVIGTSMGGLNALETVLPCLDERIPAPIVIVQHRGKDSSEALVQILQQYSPIRVIEAEDRSQLQPAQIYLAPPDYHLIVERGYLGLSLESPVNFARPSIDVLFQSASYSYKSGVVAVVMTGANVDGTLGAVYVKRVGGTVLVQDPSDCTCDVMPLSTMAAVEVDCVVALSQMAECLRTCCQNQMGEIELG